MSTATHREIAAQHEAAHVVLYLALGYPIHSVEIFDDHTGLTLSRPEPFMIDPYNHAAIKMAGVAIEDRYVYIGVEDRVAAQDEEGDVAGLTVGMANYGLTVANTILERYEAAHLALSAELAEQGRMTGPAVVEIWERTR